MDKHVVIARQAIFDASNRIIGYELLHRSLGSPNEAVITSGTAATMDVIAHGLDLVVDSIRNDQKLFINFPSQLLVENVHLLLDKNRFILELLETETIDDAFFDLVSRTKAQGYRLAFDDVDDPESLASIVEFADYIKVDFQKLHDANSLQCATKYLKRYKSTLLAEKVETYSTVDHAKKLGYKFFQGFYFSKPQLFSGKLISPNVAVHLKLISELNKAHQDYDRIAGIVSSDPVLSFKLLRYVNSPFFGQIAKTTSLKRALLLLGKKELSQWLNINLLSKAAATDMDKELIYMSAFRSKFLSILRGVLPFICKMDFEICLPSLFSHLDAILKMPFEAIFAQLGNFGSMRESLVDPASPCRKCFSLTEFFERQDREKIEACKRRFAGVDFDRINLEALEWAHRAMV